MNDICPRRSRIVIIGGGCTGATVAINLLKSLSWEQAEITIIEPRPVLGAGLAYSSEDPSHRVNVPATRLLVLPEEPGAFDAWLRSSGALDADPEALMQDGRAYPRRAVFGQYIAQLLAQTSSQLTAPSFRHVQAQAQSITQGSDAYEVMTDTGDHIPADFLVLAVSHPPPAVLGPFKNLAAHPKFIADPWARPVAARISKQDRVLLIGTALTAADIATSLAAAGHQGEVIAISRRGLASRPRGTTPAELFGDFSSMPSRTALALVRQVRAQIRLADACLTSWEAVIEAVRDQGSAIWAALPPPEKRRFLRHLRPYWDVHRYRLAPQLAAVLEAETKTGKFSTRAARVRKAVAEADHFLVTLQARRAPEDTAQTERFDAIVNCTGPDHSRVTATNPALASLAAAGKLRADEFGLGIETDQTARAIAADNTPVPNIFVAGPLARAAFGELMGLPQVTLHAALVAKQICQALAVMRV